jgi:Flp pilus assembly protein TadG
MPHLLHRTSAALRRFRRARTGATAVEFAIIAAPFFLLLMGILELALVFLVSTTLEHATHEAARQLRTGEFQMADKTTDDEFEDLVCARLAWIGDSCKAQLNIDSRAYGTISAMLTDQAAKPYDPEDTCFEAGGPGQVVLVRSSMKWKIFTPLLRPSMGASGDGTKYLRTTTAFRNEPFPDDAPGDVCAE